MFSKEQFAYISILKATIVLIVIMGSLFSSHGAIKAEWSIDQSDEPLSIQAKRISDYVTYNFGK